MEAAAQPMALAPAVVEAELEVGRFRCEAFQSFPFPCRMRVLVAVAALEAEER